MAAVSDTLAAKVLDAQEQIAKAIRVADLRNDPLCPVLEAISGSLGAQYALHLASMETREVKISSATIVRLEASASKVVTEAQGAAGRIVTEATEWVVAQMRDAAATITAGIMHETQAEVAKAEAARAVAVRAAWIAGGVSAAGVLAVCGLVLMVWKG